MPLQSNAERYGASSLSNESPDQRSLLLERRDVYGQGTIATIVHLDREAILIEQRSADRSLIISLLSTEARERLKKFL